MHTNTHNFYGHHIWTKQPAYTKVSYEPLDTEAQPHQSLRSTALHIGSPAELAIPKSEYSS